MSMTRGELLARCIPIVEAAKEGKPVEDSFVELKSELPQEEKAARGLAGLANAAGGEPVIWLVGIDEKSHKVVGAPKVEFSSWYPRIRRLFDGPAPKLSMNENIHTDGQIVVAAVFETDEAPYVFTSGPDCRDIPWREGNRTRSAYRKELLRTLAGPSLLPAAEVTSAAFRTERDSSGQLSRIIFEALIYVKPRNDRTLVFPRHDCKAYVEIPGSLPKTPFDSIWLLPGEDRCKSGSVQDDVTVDRPKVLWLMAFIGPVFGFNGQKVNVEISLLPVNASRPVVIRHELTLRVEPEIAERPHQPRNEINPWEIRSW
jgi:hypothetical protein